MQKSYCYTPGVSVRFGVSMQNIRANVKVMEFQSLYSFFFCILTRTNKAPYSKSLRQARIRLLWHLWLNNSHATILDWFLISLIPKLYFYDKTQITVFSFAPILEFYTVSVSICCKKINIDHNFENFTYRDTLYLAYTLGYVTLL